MFGRRITMNIYESGEDYLEQILMQLERKGYARSVDIAEALDVSKGMPIEQVQKLLGHEKIDTTLHYAMVKQSNVKSAHRKYIG